MVDTDLTAIASIGRTVKMRQSMVDTDLTTIASIGRTVKSWKISDVC
jgi:hypothetical protein